MPDPSCKIKLRTGSRNAQMKSTAGDSFVALLMSAVAALLAAVAGGFLGIIFSRLLPDRDGESALLLAPFCSFVLAVSVFVVVFRKISTYGENSDKE